jgi:hypothetical protein
MVSATQLRGYILEEVLAYLIRTSGYSILMANSRRQDPDLRSGRAGLEVRGRGGWHQADVLGQLDLIPAFTYPLRLFTEAKFYDSKRIGIPVIRNAVGTIVDVRHAPVKPDIRLPIQQVYRYEYALFSTTGFSDRAIEMASAYRISLIELSSGEYSSLLSAIRETADKISQSIGGKKGIVKNIRNIIRRRLQPTESLPLDVLEMEDATYDRELERLLDITVNKARGYDSLYIGTVNAPFILVLKPDSHTRFKEYALKKKDDEHHVIIQWDQSRDGGGTWSIKPVENSSAYELTFKIPKRLSDWIFGVEKDKYQRARKAKKEYFSRINIYWKNKGVDYVIKLKFNPERVKPRWSVANC